MRQLTFVKPRVLEWHDVPAPGLEGPRHAIVAPVAATTCDLDRSLIKGRTPYEGPIALGHEFVARVVDVGDAVRGIAPGDVVAVPAQISCGECDRCGAGATAFCRAVPPNSMYGLGAMTGAYGGAFSDLVRVPFANGMLVRLPGGISPPAVAAASDNLTNAFEAVAPHLARDPGASVLIAGIGGTGFYALLMAKAMGAGRVDYVDHDRDRLALASRLGAGTIEVRRGTAPPSLESQYEIAVDARGEPEELALLLRSLAPRGVCTTMSLYFRDAPLPLLQMVLRGVTLEATPTNVRAFLPEVLSLVEKGRIAPERVTTELLPWESLPEALVEPSMKPVFVRD
jgi:threonine dehydrogenase-like Zn-dependent dehydrogenase